MKVELAEDVGVMAAAGPSFTVVGTRYEMRRLGLADLFKLSAIFRDVFALGSLDARSWMSGLGEEGGTLSAALVAGFCSADRQILDFAAELVGVTYDEIRDPVKFPLESAVGFAEAFGRHPDVTAFFSRLAALQTAAASPPQAS